MHVLPSHRPCAVTLRLAHSLLETVLLPNPCLGRWALRMACRWSRCSRIRSSTRWWVQICVAAMPALQVLPSKGSCWPARRSRCKKPARSCVILPEGRAWPPTHPASLFLLIFCRPGGRRALGAAGRRRGGTQQRRVRLACRTGSAAPAAPQHVPVLACTHWT